MKPWTAAEDAELIRAYVSDTASAIAARLGRSLHSVKNRQQKLGIKKPAGYVNTGCFKPGMATWNKGMKVLDIGGKATRFKPGRKPEEARNYQPIGSVRLTKDGYLERKVCDDPSLATARRWVALHRLVWEAAYGPIPPGQVVVFKQGLKTTNEDDITPDRLELISRRELMARNTVHRLPKELAQLVQLRGALTRQINARSTCE